MFILSDTIPACDEQTEIGEWHGNGEYGNRGNYRENGERSTVIPRIRSTHQI